MAARITNTQIADLLDKIADLLETQEANPFRMRAYREGADTIRDLDHEAADWIRHDQIDKLTALPNIGEGIAGIIGEYVSSGKSNLLEQLESESSPAQIFARVPGIGQELAERIADQLDITTLEELKKTAHNGHLAEVEGFGHRRVEAVQTALAGMLSQSARRSQQRRNQERSEQQKTDNSRPPVELLVEIDAEYREGAKNGRLKTIAPRRFNPDHEAWLPVLHTKKDGWVFTALYSNTAQAHKLDKTDDWVVIYYERDGKEQQNTVVTEMQGTLKGKRVVRGRSLENRQYYEAGVRSKMK